MGRLLDRANSRSWPLAAEQTFGRATDCLVPIRAAYVSSHHAEIRWTEGGWQVKDLGSKNGTFVNSERLQTGVWHLLRRGDVASFGDPEAEQWELTHDDRPAPLLVPLDGAPPIPVDDTMLGLPPEAPEATVWEDDHGSWWFEAMDKPAVVLERDTTIQVGQHSYRFVCDEKPSTTQLVKQGHDVRLARLHIRHSLDEEHVEAVADVDGRSVSLGDRQHHYLLLALTRQRLEDRAQGIPEGSCGWIYLEDLMDRLKVDRTQLNLHVYRLRKQFLAAGFLNASAVIERRVQTRQIRVGFKELLVSHL